ncbi:MAG: hypothetical protein ABFS35_08030 [Bacteroidota bacterium]
MKKQSLLLLATIVFTINSIAQETNSLKNINNMVFEYSDGNGNLYIVTQDSIFFQPVSKQMSSSGLYDGGEPSKNKITQKDFKKVYLEFESIFKNDIIQIPNRIKTSGLLIIREVGTKKKVFIIKKSDEQRNLESMLKELIK